MATVRDLYDFIDRAENDRKYAPNTALGRKTALLLYEKYLNEEEKSSVEILKDRLDRISQIVDSKNKNFKSTTLLVYKKRVKNLLEDFNNYGKSSSTMATWKAKANSSKTSTKKHILKIHDKVNIDDKVEIPELQPAPSFINNLHDLNVQLRPDLRLSIPLPYDLTRLEANRLKLLIDSMVVHDEENRSGS